MNLFGRLGPKSWDESGIGAEVTVQGAGSREQGAGSREQGAGSREQGAGSREQGAGLSWPEAPGCLHPGAALLQRLLKRLRWPNSGGANPILLSKTRDFLVLPAWQTVTPPAELIQTLAPERDDRLCSVEVTSTDSPPTLWHLMHRGLFAAEEDSVGKLDFPHSSADHKAPERAGNFFLETQILWSTLPTHKCTQIDACLPSFPVPQAHPRHTHTLTQTE